VVKASRDAEYVIGLDIGTSSAKGCVFDVNGNVVAEARKQYSVISPRLGWREQNAEWWWDAVKAISRELVKKAGLNSRNLKGIAITHQRLTMVPVDENVNPIYNAILWNDVRCTEEVEIARKEIGEKEILKKTGTPPGYWTIYKILWIKRNLPEIYERTFKFVLVPDFICFRLCGRLATTQSAAILTGALDAQNPSKWRADLLEALGLSENVLVDEILPSGVVLGEVTEEASRETSLPKGTSVVTAAGDQPCGSLGAGLIKSDQVAVNGGTSCTSEVISEELPPLDEPNYYLEISPTGKYILETTIPSGGSELMIWFRKNFGAKLEKEAEEAGQNVWAYIYDQAKRSPPGAMGMMLVPSFNSIGPPYWDLNTGGIIIGLTTDTKTHHFIRAIMEGLAFEVKRHAKMLEEATGVKVTEILMYGGSSRSDVWNQIFSDVLNVKLSVPHTPETTSLGAAICAAVGARIYNSFDEAVKKMVHVEKTYSPRKDRAEIYEELFTKCYLHIYGRLREVVMTSIRIAQKAEGTNITAGENIDLKRGSS